MLKANVLANWKLYWEGKISHQCQIMGRYLGTFKGQRLIEMLHPAVQFIAFTFLQNCIGYDNCNILEI